VLFCARWAQQQASQEKQAGNGRNEERDRGGHVPQYSVKTPRRKPAPARLYLKFAFWR
jgi:hypothetical protein